MSSSPKDSKRDPSVPGLWRPMEAEGAGGRAGIRAFIFGAKSHLWILGHSDISFEDMLSMVIENLSFNDQDISFFDKFAVEF